MYVIINTYAPNINFVKRMLLDIKGEIGPCTIIVGDFKTLPSSIDTIQQKSSELNCRRNQSDLADSYRMFH
jgi:hypothetical protein